METTLNTQKNEQCRASGKDDTVTDPEGFNVIAQTIFAPAYPVIAAQILAEAGISCGLCLDIGCGGGHLGLAMAGQSDFSVVLMDPADDMGKIALRNAAAAGLSDRVQVLKGSAEEIPLPDNSVDLAISRGSVFFWNDQVKAFREIYRILKPLAMAYIGGGFGSSAIRDQIIQKMKQRNKGEDTWRKKMGERIGPDAVPRFSRILEESGVPGFNVSHDNDKGLWIVFRKEAP